MLSFTKMWYITKDGQRTGYELEETPGGFALWGPCEMDHTEGEECIVCEDTGEGVVSACIKTSDFKPSESNMISDKVDPPFDFERYQ